MSFMRIGSGDYTAMNDIDQTTETTTNFRRTVDTAEQDIPGFDWTNANYSKWFGYYKNIPELQAVINNKAVWTVGRGYEGPKYLKDFKGCGKDSFNTILWNLCVQYTVGGDAFAEIVRKGHQLINIKPLNPRWMTIKSNERGIITGYEQFRYNNIGKRVVTGRFGVDEILHMARNRVGDEIHGRSTVEKMEWVVDAKNEIQKDMRIIFHRYVKPLVITYADTDDEAEIAALKIKLDKAVQSMENLIMPKGSVEIDRMSIPQYSTLDPMPWIQFLQTMFIMAEGVPEVILGYGRDTTEASSKILYLAYQQTIEHNQLFIEECLKNQCNLEIELNFPADMAPGLQDDVRKERKVNTYESKGVFDKVKGLIGR